MVYALTTLGGWQNADTIANTFFAGQFQKALAIRPNFQIRTNTNQISDISNFTVAPNPTNGLLNLNIETSQMEDMQIRIYNLNGQMVMNTYLEKANNIQKTIDLSSQANGVYMVSLITSKGIITRKVVKE